MANYSIPQDVFVKAAEQYGTPLWIYDRATIEKCVKDVQVFDTVRFAQKACPNLSVVSLIRKLATDERREDGPSAPQKKMKGFRFSETFFILCKSRGRSARGRLFLAFILSSLVSRLSSKN